MKDFIVKRRKNYVQFTCRIEEDMLEKIKHIVLDYDLDSVNSFINDCLRFALKNMKTEEWKFNIILTLKFEID